MTTRPGRTLPQSRVGSPTESSPPCPAHHLHRDRLASVRTRKLITSKWSRLEQHHSQHRVRSRDGVDLVDGRSRLHLAIRRDQPVQPRIRGVMTFAAFAAYVVHNTRGRACGSRSWRADRRDDRSLVIARMIYLPFMHRGTTQFAMVMVTVAVSIIIKNVLQAMTGATFYSYGSRRNNRCTSSGWSSRPRSRHHGACGAEPARATRDIPVHPPRQSDARHPDDSALARTAGSRRPAIINAAWIFVRVALQASPVLHWRWTSARSTTTPGGLPAAHRGCCGLRQRR